MWVDLLLIAGLVFFVGLLFVFLRLLFGFLLTFILLAFISHSFLLRFFDFSVVLRGRILAEIIRPPWPRSLTMIFGISLLRRESPKGAMP